jgi:hypothetical protein
MNKETSGAFIEESYQSNPILDRLKGVPGVEEIGDAPRMVVVYTDHSTVFPSPKAIERSQKDWEQAEQIRESGRRAVNKKVYNKDFTSNLIGPMKNFENMIFSGGTILEVYPSED